MINRINKIIYIHIPKCAGSSIERFFSAKPFNWKEPNYEFLVGWDPKRKIHLQHATPKQLLELDLIDEVQWNEAFKFAIVRNPWERLVSSYNWLKKEHKISGTFYEFLTATGPYISVLSDISYMTTRHEHLVSQQDYLSIDGNIAVDYVGRFENLASDFKYIMSLVGLSGSLGYHEKKGVYDKRFHYSHLFGKKEIEWVNKHYSWDINYLDYEFEDNRSWIKRMIFPLKG